jgi:hypothetical protein
MGRRAGASKALELKGMDGTRATMSDLDRGANSQISGTTNRNVRSRARAHGHLPLLAVLITKTSGLWLEGV